MAKTRKAGKRGGVKLSPREKYTRSKQRKLKTAENKIARLEKRLATADKKVQAAQNKLDNVYLNAKARVDKEHQNAENINNDIFTLLVGTPLAFAAFKFPPVE